MRPHSPIERSPVAPDLSKSRSVDRAPSEISATDRPRSIPVREAQDVSDEEVDAMRTLAESVADQANLTEDIREDFDAEAIKPEPPRTFADRVRTILRIPKSISSELSRTERAGEFKEVEAFNADETQMPSIVRSTNKPLLMSAFGSLLAMLGATHEPEVEQIAKRGVEVAQDATTATVSGIKKIYRTISKEAFASERSHNPTHDKFFDSLPDLSEEARPYAEKLMQEFEHGELLEHMEDFFLTMQLTHRQINERQFKEAKIHVGEITKGVHDKLANVAEAKNNPVLYAFELAKQRKTYLRDEAGVYAMIMKEEGNCESLVDFLLSTVPQAYGSTPEMAVQVYTDHVRFLVRDSKNGDKTWHWIDGHSWGDLTPDEMKGTLIVDPMDVVKATLQLQKAQSKTEQIPTNKQFNYKTNTVLAWQTMDARVPQHASHQGPIPERVDERKEAKQTFEKASKRERDAVEYIPVSPDGISTDTSSKQETKPEALEPTLIAPSAEEIFQALKTGRIEGAFNDLHGLEGMNIREVVLRPVPRPRTTKEPILVDLSPLKDAKLELFDVEHDVRVAGQEQISFKHLKVLSVRMMQTHLSLSEKFSREAEHPEILTVSVQADSFASKEAHRIVIQDLVNIIKTDKTAQLMVGSLQKKFRDQRKGIITLTIDLPYENGVVTLTDNTERHEWSISGTRFNDYLSDETRDGVDLLKFNDGAILLIPSNVTSDEYLNVEHADLMKIKQVIIKDVDLDKTSGWLAPTTNFTALRNAKNLRTVFIRTVPGFDNVDLTVLRDLPISEVIIETETPMQNKYSVKGLEGTNIQVRTKQVSL